MDKRNQRAKDWEPGEATEACGGVRRMKRKVTWEMGRNITDSNNNKNRFNLSNFH